MVDRHFSDAKLASLYDLFCPWDAREDFAFYFPLVMSANSVLDVGCGTGVLLHTARRSGHTGRLCGVDPADGMLAQARRRADIEWVRGNLGAITWEREFDLIIMTGHAFQVLIHDDEIRTGLTAVRRALTEGGRFVFETRNPLAREWERWTPDDAVEVTDAEGTVVRKAHHVEEPVDGELVIFTTTYTSPSWDRPRESRSTLRFLDVDTLSAFLAEARLTIVDQFGDWTKGPVTPTSLEIVTVTSA